MDKAKVLIVDDMQHNRLILKMSVEKLGHLAILAIDGIDALEKINQQLPDIILLDLTMPRMNGFEVMQKLKSDSQTQMIPIIVVTSLDDLENKVHALECGADDFLGKPVQQPELIARIRSSLKVKAYYDHMKEDQLRLEEAVAMRTHELREAFLQIKNASLDTIQRLAKAAEYKDTDTGSHILRMSQYSVIIAQNLNLSKELVERIMYAAPMHDIGKIGIPDNILLKPEKLNDDEWVIMKTHTFIGEQILSGSKSEIIEMGRLIALNHHEKWDGSGYPHGISGDDIPLCARIVAVADVFDALMSKRKYKEAFSLDKAVALMKESTLSHFDAKVLEVFFKYPNKILEVLSNYQDFPL